MQAIIDSSKLPVNVIFVSDHGMSLVDTVNILKPPAADSTRFRTAAGDMIIHLYSRSKDRQEIQSEFRQLKAAAAGYDVYLASSTPSRWKYNAANDRYGRIGDILIVPRYPRIFSWGNRRLIPGRHGYDPYRYKEMHASFYAWGPQIRSGKTIGTFQNVHVYSLVAELLQLKISTQTDSRNTLSRKVLR